MNLTKSFLKSYRSITTSSQGQSLTNHTTEIAHTLTDHEYSDKSANFDD